MVNMETLRKGRKGNLNRVRWKVFVFFSLMRPAVFPYYVLPGVPDNSASIQLGPRQVGP